MDISKNYYFILNVPKDSTEVEIKKAYYKLSLKHHPDRGGDGDSFNLINESYSTLIDKDLRNEYDVRSKWGKNYDETLELLDFEFSNDSKIWNEEEWEDFKKNRSLNVIIYIDDEFSGDVEYNRWVLCKKCKGSGKDIDSKIEIKNSEGKIIKTFDGSGGCDFCEGTGKDYRGNNCFFCGGLGKIGSKDCMVCKGKKRILGKQKLSGIVFPEGEKSHKIEYMGNTLDSTGRCGHLWLVKK